MTITTMYNCWCKHNDNENNIKRNWIIFLNYINLKREITQHYLDWGTTLALFKEIQALSWLNFVTGADRLWLVFPMIQQPNKCRMARTTSAQSVQAQNSTRKNTLPCQEPLYFFFFSVYCSNLDWVWMSPFLKPPSFTSSLHTYLTQYLRQFTLTINHHN